MTMESSTIRVDQQNASRAMAAIELEQAQLHEEARLRDIIVQADHALDLIEAAVVLQGLDGSNERERKAYLLLHMEHDAQCAAIREERDAAARALAESSAIQKRASREYHLYLALLGRRIETYER